MSYGNYLCHHGIKGQKHGVRNGPPYPLQPGDHSASEKKAGWRQSLSDTAASIKKKRLEKKVEKAKKESEKKNPPELSEEDKQLVKARAMMSGNAKTVYANRDLMTNQELQAAINRVDMDMKLKSIMAKDKPDVGAKVDDAMKWVDRGIKIYNLYANISNAREEQRHINLENEGKSNEEKQLKKALVKTGGDKKKK